jgi:peroxisomal membrane protein 2
MVVDMDDEESSSLLHHRHHAHQNESSAKVDDGPAARGAAVALSSVFVPRTWAFSSWWERYVTLVEKHPLLVKSITATIILGGADLCGQGLEHLRSTNTATDIAGVDWFRAARFAAFGLFGAPWSHYYFHWLDHYLPPSSEPWTGTTAVKVFIDQFIQAPILLGIMICALSLMKGQGISGAKRDMRDNFVDSLIANCKSQQQHTDCCNDLTHIY